MNKLSALIGLLLIALALIWYITLRLAPSNSESKSKAPSQTAKQLLLNMNTYLGMKAIPRATDAYDWIGGNGQHLPLEAQMIVIGTSGINGIGQYGTIQNDDITKVTEPFIQGLSDKISSYFSRNGFKKDITNSTNTFDEMFTKRTGYTEGNTYCITNVSLQSTPFAYVVCGTIDAKQLALLQEFTPLSNPPSTNSINYVFRVQKVEGNFAQGYISNMVGSGFFAKKVNGKWQMILQTPDEPLCSDVKKYQIPQSIYNHCASD